MNQSQGYDKHERPYMQKAVTGHGMDLGFVKRHTVILLSKHKEQRICNMDEKSKVSKHMSVRHINTEFSGTPSIPKCRSF